MVYWRRFALCTCAASVLTAASACGLDEVGLQSVDASSDGFSAGDVVTDSQRDAVQGCATVDASACVDASIPDGWTLVAYGANGGTCPAAFDSYDYVRDPKLEAGACGCGCSSTGSYSCGGTIAYGTSCGNCQGGVNNCNNRDTANSGPDGGCFPTSTSAPDFAVGALPTASPIGVGCDASAVGTQTFTATPATVCAPHCDADYCASRGTMRTCVVSNQTTCPAPFAPADTIGLSGDVSVSCAACTCTTSQNGDCNGSVAYFANSNSCGGTGTSINASSCKTTGGTSIGSFRYSVTVPTVQCAPSEGSGDAGFAKSLTVCCLN